MDWVNRCLDLLILLFVGYEQKRIDDAVQDAEKSKLALHLIQDKEAISDKYSGQSDIDVVNDAISAGGGSDSDRVQINPESNSNTSKRPPS